ncbi:MAG: hypothetical protein JWN69_987 [Alphaproteobacteria bacterium]|nr:hypothetical protein [Alphaproteobacteria bacterium]
MKFSNALEVTLVGLLVLSLGLKLGASRGEPPPDGQLFASQVSGFLEREGYSAAAELRPLGMMVTAQRDGCRLAIRNYPPHGTLAQTYARLARPVGPLHFVYRGRVTDRAPKLLPLIEYFIGRELRRLGVAAPRAPILAVAASRGCDIGRLRWEAISTFAR